MDDVFIDRQFRLFWGVDKSKLIALFSNYYITSFSDACKVVYLSYNSLFKKKNIRVIVDKNPSYALFINYLIKIFPEAKFIHLVRDPRAVVSSIKIALKSNVYKMAYLWVFINNLIETNKNAAIFLTIKYEDVVKTPETTFQFVFNFLKINLNNDFLNAHLTIEKAINKHNYYSLKIHKNVSTAINKENIDNWKNKLSEKEENSINFLCADFAKKYGYEITKPTFTPKELKEFNAAIKPKLFSFSLLIILYYKLPLFVRKYISSKLMSLFLDKKYKKNTTLS